MLRRGAPPSHGPHKGPLEAALRRNVPAPARGSSLWEKAPLDAGASQIGMTVRLRHSKMGRKEERRQGKQGWRMKKSERMLAG